MVIPAIKRFFTPEPEESVEVSLESRLGNQFSKFFSVYGIELGGNESNALYLIAQDDSPSSASVVLRSRVRFTRYPQQYDLTQLGIPYNEFEAQVIAYFEKQHPLVQREFPNPT